MCEQCFDWVVPAWDLLYKFAAAAVISSFAWGSQDTFNMAGQLQLWQEGLFITLPLQDGSEDHWNVLKHVSWLPLE